MTSVLRLQDTQSMVAWDEERCSRRKPWAPESEKQQDSVCVGKCFLLPAKAGWPAVWGPEEQPHGHEGWYGDSLLCPSVTVSPHDLIWASGQHVASETAFSPAHGDNVSSYTKLSKETDARSEWPSEVEVLVFSQMGVKLKYLIKV